MASAVTLEASAVVSVSTITSIDTVFVAFVGTLVVVFINSTSCFSGVSWVLLESMTSVVTFSVVSVVCIG